jgi:hypothetical protein
MPKISGPEAYAKDSAVAAIVSAGRVRLQTRMISARGVRESLTIVDGATFLKVLRELSEEVTVPAWLSTVLTALTVPVGAHWAYFDTLQCAWGWLQGDGLDLAATKTRSMLDLIVAGHPELVSASVTLKALAEVSDPVSVADVSLAIRGPWGDE